MTKLPTQTLSHDLHEMASEVSDHLNDAAEKTGQEARDALHRSSAALSKAVERIKTEAHALSPERVAAEVRAHPAITATIVASVIAILGLLVAARQFPR